MSDRLSWQPDPDSEITVDWIEANGQKFEVAQAGEGDRLALCLHGFPELHYSWRFQMPLLAEMGYRVWAPNLRGYGGTSKPEGVRAYALDHLCADIAALIDASGAKEVTLIAHDWGAIIAWAFAIQKIRPLVRLIIMNVPHPMVGRREIRHWRQLRRSWYIFFFQIPWLPEKLLSRNGGRPIKDAFSKMACDQTNFSNDALDIYARAALRPGSLNSMINYYRALLRHRDAIDIGDGKVNVPTLMIWGEEDSALNIKCTEGTEEWVGDFTLHRLPGVSHWVQQEAPEEVNAILRDWLS
ncbi:Pimeloyl-ACP methyl ester carboxylesterase [Parasphingorhabdus marina DSM 22363]|uniref:Pimeloyl-ACP methyl ester carboxylesterase n=1 Tax=Parasphingorhabdus marina DSM 22363 TaxID=1123272 RepID=A0A1N6ERD4_9SPHN|nr:alpha/beta hydrolase [Parasphingorhabdus marina]SIN85540.1 Pimeloyl-ACP methyl ester carboxylesterase [Parasphingorhabdus marina DSM 22363]